MLALFAANQGEIARIRSSLPAARQVTVFEDWDRLEQRIGVVDCSVVQIGWLPGSRFFSELSALKSRHPMHPVVLVTRWNRENARQIKNILIEEVVWSREITEDLETAAQHACSREFNYMRCLAVPFEEAEHLPYGLRRALAYACRNERPVCKVKQLSAATGYDRRRLSRYWREAVGESTELHLSDFLRCLVLLRVVGQKTPQQNWAEAAKALGVHPHTLGSYAKNYAGRTLPDLEGGGKKELVQIFRERILAFLLQEDELDRL